MAELVYPPVIVLARSVFRALGIRFTVEGSEHIPAEGGAVLASNHVSYLDFTFCGLVARPQKRLVRFMCKESVFEQPVAGQLMRGMHHIPVDRSAGAAALSHAVRALKEGEIVGLFPEATISRSYTLKEFKSGAARMAAEADVPIVPMAIWGGQRIYTKARKPDLGRGKAVMLKAGEAFRPEPGADPMATTAELHRRVDALLHELQDRYPQEPTDDADRWWLPVERGGTAPTPERAKELDAAAVAATAQKRREKLQKKKR
ncbi:1-acyl-sn-glycerol-3-phosphate acyltransferase [Kineosporia sp. NBRC 101677]|uniref:lysophospholipid acyltransferase family protein n=1 Tax=Kineosporia sp. NBRC 101677 TaxID=3032197 RepID=UPI0024A4F820|nr:lysophospholipid acyltransferase family protein [Kineosporia sp. NBRC 101677]GLY14107.1 1-acyl-sn-glycerol-3-phosphate acyltransferase [Kineosporia sp. NBRC 101677]